MAGIICSRLVKIARDYYISKLMALAYSFLQQLDQVSRANAGTQLIAKEPMNIIRNRYRDVLPSKFYNTYKQVGVIWDFS